MTAERSQTAGRADPLRRLSATPRRGTLTLAVVLWLAATFVTWNVAFDRQLSIEAARFAHQNVLWSQEGRSRPTIDAGFRPLLSVAALRATLWASAVLAAGAVTLALARRRAGALPTP